MRTRPSLQTCQPKMLQCQKIRHLLSREQLSDFKQRETLINKPYIRSQVPQTFSRCDICPSEFSIPIYKGFSALY